jgi:predicted flap endonuclease-1-like 5' DNA nuclease
MLGLGTWVWWLVLGALIGWLVEWVIDWVYWRQRIAALQSEIENGRSTYVELTQIRGERDRLAADLRACGERSDRLTQELAPLRARVAELEPLQAQVGELAPLRARVAELEPLQAQVGELAPLRARVAELEPLQAQVGEIDPLRARVAELEAANLRLTEDLAARETSFGQWETPSQDGAALDQRDGDGAAQTFGFALPSSVTTERDPLVDINGIGPVYERRLFAAGVTTFAQLAGLSPDTIRAIIQPESWQLIEPEAWIAEARQFAEQVRDGTYRKGGA